MLTVIDSERILLPMKRMKSCQWTIIITFFFNLMSMETVPNDFTVLTALYKSCNPDVAYIHYFLTQIYKTWSFLLKTLPESWTYNYI